MLFEKAERLYLMIIGHPEANQNMHILARARVHMGVLNFMRKQYETALKFLKEYNNLKK